ncbi:myelin protein zero-like protein 1 isoform X1 [Acipenser ruthenus]|uniref:myelin protein zero-like protein 1 isoform X1 n=1 Tax=Acipenser ruthenus TaxID=7906 RepID=UPI00145BDB0F|nr:myelin protein zero-like protein 1 isoform X1 [Acipenser ruthenus]XP_033867949.3 myelin protein zero-like protein 1 isoform X1 [Acipenser ruthenus]
MEILKGFYWSGIKHTMGAKVRNPSQILAVWLGFQLLSWAAVPGSAVDVYTPAELFVENGTDGTLRCTFTSKDLVSSGTSLSWDFHPEGGGDTVSLFHYTGGKPYFGKTPQFKDRVLWVGDLNKKDASITITKMIFKDNGTYSCIVKNPPDIDVKPSSIHLQVVERVSVEGSLPLSNAGVIAGAVIGAILGLLIILVIVFYLLVRRKQASKDYIGCSSSESVVPQETRALKKEGSDKEDSRCSSPSGPAQGPVIYAQLDHSGKKMSNTVYKTESVVYANIRKD